MLLTITILAALILPANMVFEPLGATGYVAMVVALVLFAVWSTSILWGTHDPVSCRHPARIGLTLFWIATVVSYIRMAGVDAVQRASADRWLLSLSAISALMMVTAEAVRSTDHALTVARTVALGATVCSVLAALQFVTRTDPLDIVRPIMVGMIDNGGQTTFQDRGALIRVAGNTFTPIELGVITAMVLPLCVWRALHDPAGRIWVHWLQCVAIAFASAITVSRSAVLGLTVSVLVTVPFLPRHAKRWAAIAIPVIVICVFVAVPGLIATLASTISSGSGTDPSLATRLNNYPRVQAMVIDDPWFGTGPSTYLPTNALELLDNQYLHSAVEMGLPGFVAFTALMICPVIAAFSVALWSREPRLRLLAATVASGCLVAAISSAVFDSLSFPVFRLLWPVFAGLSGAVWLMARGAPHSTLLSPPRSERK